MFGPPRSVRSNLIGSEPDDWSRAGVVGRHCEDEHTWTFGRKRAITFRKLAQRWKNVKRGMDIDIDAGKELGEKAPDEYWRRVWTDMHRGNGGPPVNLHHVCLQEKWSELKDTGKTDEECWDTLEIQYPVAFLGLPLLKRWESLGEGKSIDEIKGDMFGWLDEFNGLFLQKKLKERLEEMKNAGEEESFWRTNWDVVHKAKCIDMRKEDGEAFIFPVIERNDHGDLVRIEPKYKQDYPNEFGRRSCCINRRSNSIESQPLFRQFDFV